MKKILLAVLALCLVLCFAACDQIGIGPDDETKEPAVDVPEKNVDAIVSTLNDGIRVEDIINSEGNSDAQASVEQFKAELAKLVFETTLSAKSEDQAIEGYIGFKNNTLFLSATDSSDTYVFIEDDFKLVTVYPDSDGGYSGSVDDSLYSYFENLSSTVEGEDGEKIQQFLDAISGMKLPEISATDIEYRDGRYYLGEEYIDKTIDKVAGELMSEYKKVFPESLTDDMIAETKATLQEYVDKLGAELWLNAKYEKITGFGVKITADSELSDEIGVEKLDVMIDVDGGKTEIDAAVTVDGQSADIKATFEVITDSEGKPEKLSASVTGSIPDNEYFYDAKIFSTVDIKMDYRIDLTKLSADGELLSFKLDCISKDIKAYVMNPTTFEYEYSEEKTEKYADKTNSALIDITVVSAESGKKFSGTMDYCVTEITDTANSDIDLEFVLTATADKMPAIPGAVQEAREDAIEEYNNPSYGWDDDWDDDWDDEYDW